MYIKKVTLKHIRCFENLTLDFSSDGDIDKLAIIAGDNGAGKTTLVRCIALGLCDQDNATALLRDLGSELICRDHLEANINIELMDGKKIREIKITFGKNPYGVETISNYEPKKNKQFPWKKLFVCGYGANRGIGGSDEPAEQYQVSDAVYTLINYDWPLLDAEKQFWRIVAGDERIKGDTKIANKEKREKLVCNILRQILELQKKDSVALTNKGIRLKIGNAPDLPISACADGYEATITWLLDLLGRFHQANLSQDSKIPKAFPINIQEFTDQLKGIVIIDEIEQHLHPKWQKGIISQLAKQFPNIQFIGTTHSPLVLSSSEKCKVFALKNGQKIDQQPYGWLAEDVYSLMGVNDSRSKQFTAEVLAKYEKLLNKQIDGKATKSDLLKIQELRKKLASLPERDPVSLTMEIKSITNSLNKPRNK